MLIFRELSSREVEILVITARFSTTRTRIALNVATGSLALIRMIVSETATVKTIATLIQLMLRDSGLVTFRTVNALAKISGLSQTAKSVRILTRLIPSRIPATCALIIVIRARTLTVMVSATFH